MKKFLWGIIPLSVALILSGGGCGTATPATPPAPTPTLTPVGEFTIYQPPTSTAVSTPIPLPDVTQSPKLPTPTPFVHTIQEGDTLSGIALRYGSSVDKIILANPEANPQFLIIGEELVIPPGDDESVTNLPTATPFPVSLDSPHCWPANQDGLWCFLEASTASDTPLENVSAILNLLTPGGEVAASEIALPPLNVLYPGETLPLMAYFSAPIPETFQASTTLLTALPTSEQNAQAALSDLEIAYSSDRLQAALTGTFSLSEEDSSTSQIWVVEVAYDAQERIVGVRRVEVDVEPASGESVSFALNVFSLGQPIERVEVLYEVVGDE